MAGGLKVHGYSFQPLASLKPKSVNQLLNPPDRTKHLHTLFMMPTAFPAYVH